MPPSTRIVNHCSGRVEANCETILPLPLISKWPSECRYRLPGPREIRSLRSCGTEPTGTYAASQLTGPYSLPPANHCYWVMSHQTDEGPAASRYRGLQSWASCSLDVCLLFYRHKSLHKWSFDWISSLLRTAGKTNCRLIYLTHPRTQPKGSCSLVESNVKRIN